MAFLEWYCFHHWKKTTGISEERWTKLNKFEKLMTPLRYLNPQDEHSYMQGDMIVEKGVN